MEAVAEITAAVTNAPVLRFPEFEEEWQLKKIGELCKVKHGFAFKGEYFSENGPYIVLTPGNFNPEGGFRYQGQKEKYYLSDDFPKDYVLEEGDLLTVMTEQAVGLIGSALIVPKSGLFLHNQRLGLFQVNKEVKREFLAFYMATEYLRTEFSKTAAGTKVRHTSPQKIEGISVRIPSLDEQQKIASFLSATDEKIQQLSKKKFLLEKYKKGVMQQIFSQQIRFKDDNGNDFPEWEEKKLGQVFKRVKTKNAENNKNVLTISAQHGLINQEDFFNKSVSAENVTGYYLLHKGDFAYNKSYSKGYPMGAIKRLTKYDKGVVSTLYICFKIKDGSSEEYFEQYFNSGFLNSELHKIAQEGARNHGLLNMSVVEFFNDIKLPRPCEEEQTKIANFLTSIDNKISYTSKQLEQAQQFKKGLLQQMFV